MWTEQAARPGLEAMRMRSRVGEAEALLDPDRASARFLVAEWRASTATGERTADGARIAAELHR